MVSFHQRYVGEAQTLHEEFRQARVARRWTIDRVAHALAISSSYIQAIEEGRWGALPGGVYTRQFLCRYAELLGLDTTSVRGALRAPDVAWASLERRRLDVPQIPRVRPWPWQFARLMLIIGILATVGWYFGSQIRVAFQPPALRVDVPHADMVLTEPYLEVRGLSARGAHVTVNDVAVPLRPDGSFSIPLVLLPGQNAIRVVAARKRGKPNIVERVVTVVQQ